jgi:hypothetical protein
MELLFKHFRKKYSQYPKIITVFINIPHFPVYLKVLSCVEIVIVSNRVYHNTHLIPLSFSLYTSEVRLTPINVLYFTVISDLKFIASLYKSDFIRRVYLHVVEVLEKIIFCNLFFWQVLHKVYIKHTFGFKFKFLYTIHWDTIRYFFKNKNNSSRPNRKKKIPFVTAIIEIRSR